MLFHSQLGKWTEHSSKSYNGFDKLKNSTNFTILEYNNEDFVSSFSLQAPVVGIKPLILRLRVECSASEQPYSIKLNIKMLFSLSFHTFLSLSSFRILQSLSNLIKLLWNSHSSLLGKIWHFHPMRSKLLFFLNQFHIRLSQAFIKAKLSITPF